MEEKILSVLLDMQIDIKKIQKEQQEMKREIQGVKAEQKEMKAEQKSMKEEQKSMKELQEITIKRLDKLEKETRISRINIAKILEVSNETREFLKNTIKQNNKEHEELNRRINNLEIKRVIS